MRIACAPDTLANDVRKSQRAGPGVIAIREDQIQLG